MLLYAKVLEIKNIQKSRPILQLKKTMRANNALIKNLFLKQEIAYLTNFQHISSNFYALPKIDKSKMSQ